MEGWGKGDGTILYLDGGGGYTKPHMCDQLVTHEMKVHGTGTHTRAHTKLVKLHTLYELYQTNVLIFILCCNYARSSHWGKLREGYARRL